MVEENDVAVLKPTVITVHDDRVIDYWVAGNNRQVYFLNSNNQWVLGTKLPNGMWEGNMAGQTVIVDPTTGTAGEWSPNENMYINSRSPYGTNYILNLKWAYQNNWITKEQILELYQYEKQINDLNYAFMDKYIEDYRKTRQLYNEAVNNYDIAQDGYESTLYAMENKYYNVDGKYSEGTTYCFHKAPLGTFTEGGKKKIKLFHCYSCGLTRGVDGSTLVDPTGNNNNYTLSSSCPVCHSTDIQVDKVYIPIYSDFTFEYKESDYPYGTDVTRLYEGHQYNPHLKGYFQRLVMSLDRSNASWTIEDYENRVSMIKGIPMEDRTVTLADGYIYKLDGVYVRSTSGQIEVWNEAVLNYIKNYGDMLSYLRTVNEMLERIKKLDEIYDQWKAMVDGLHATIQEKFGDYLIEGNYANKEQPYINLLFKEGLEASDKYSVPEITYNLNVIDSSGLVEYREPTITKYRCGECDYISYTPITTCPRCSNTLIITENDVYNDLVRLLHSVGQIVPKAGDYVSIYDEPMGMYGVPGLITQITRYPDNPINNKIELNTSYTDDEELVGNIINATNTVLNNADIYARTAILKSDGTIDENSIRETLDDSNANLTIVGTNGNILLDGSGLRATDPSDPHRAMKYAGNGIFNTTNFDNTANDPVIWEKMMSPSGINATYINSGSIDTNKLTIMSGLSGKVVIDQYGLTVKKNAAKVNHITTFNYSTAKTNANYPSQWGTDNNIASFIGVDTENNPLIYTKGMLVAEEGSNIANWITDNSGFYHLNGQGNKDLWLSPTGITGTVNDSGSKSFAIYSNGNFGVTTSGDMYSKSGKIAGWTINADKLSSSNVTLSSKTGATEKAINVNNGTFYVQNNGKMYANGADVTGTITTDNLTATNGSISNITASNFTMNSGSLTIGSNFKVTSDGKLTCSSANVSGTITATSGTIGGCSITGGSLKVSSGHITSVNADVINAGTLKGRKIECGNSYIAGDGNSMQFTNSTAWLSMNAASTHPYASALNVNGISGISIRSRDSSVSNVGSQVAQIN